MADKTLTTGCRIQRRAYREVDGVKWAKPRDWVVWQRFESGGHIGLWVFYSDTGTYAVTEFVEYILNDRFEDWELKFEIIWHPVMIGDVLDWINTNIPLSMEREVVWKDEQGRTVKKVKQRPKWYVYGNDRKQYVTNYRKQLRLPIDQQSDETIKYVYDLVCNV